MEVRIAKEEDANALARLNQKFNGGNLQSIERIMKHLNENDELVAVTIIENNIVGFACAQSFSSFCYVERQAEITEMYVEESARRQGAASKMIALLEKHLIKRGVSEIKILTNKANVAAIHTYEQAGYTKEAEQMMGKNVRITPYR